MPDTLNTPDAAAADPLGFWAEAVADTVLTAENLDNWLRQSARNIPRGGTPAGRVAALAALWRALEIPDSPNGPAERAKAFLHRIAGRTTAHESRLAELLHAAEREMTAALKAGGNCATDPVILTADFGEHILPVHVMEEFSGCWLIFGRLDKLPEGHHVRQALPLADAYQWTAERGYPAKPWILLGSPTLAAKGRSAADWYFLRDALRLTGVYEQRRRKREEERAAGKEWAKERREKERAADPREKTRRLESEVAALRAEVDRLKGAAAAGRAVPT